MPSRNNALPNPENRMDDALLPLYRVDDPVAEKQRILNEYTGLYAAIALIGVMCLAYPASHWDRVLLDLDALAMIVLLWGVTPLTYPLKKKFPKTMQLILPKFVEEFGLLNWIEKIPKELKQQRSGLTAELRVAESIVKSFKDQKVKVYSRLDKNCLVAKASEDDRKPKDVDVVAVFPNGVRVAISVKERKTAKAVYIDQHNQIRQSRKGSTLKMTDPDPAVELIEQEKWLRQYRKNILLTPGNSVLAPSVRVLVFASPTIIGHKDWHEYVTLDNGKYLKATRGKDFVYLLQEDQLCAFIDALLKRK